jgi:hypothetical protein
MHGKYIYGVIVGSGDTVLGVRGLVGSSPVYTIAHEGLSCVVSDYTGGSFDAMPKEEMARCLMTHQAVVEKVVRKHPILPLQFGMVLANSDEVHELLAQGHPQFFLTLLWIQNKVELEVVASWAGGRVIEEEDTEPETLPAGESFPPESIKASKGQHRQNYLERMIGFLQPVSVDVQPHPVNPGGMAASVAFLVDEANLEAFHSRIKQLNAFFYNQIDFQVIGPLPPYSFVTVEVNQPNPETIGEAQRLLNLSEVADEVEVRQACQRLMAEAGSERKPGVLVRARSAALRRAADLLVAYCRGQSEKGGRFLISIRRARADEVQPPRLVEIGT